jgi:RNA polymerase sigma-70 factor (family 1)
MVIDNENNTQEEKEKVFECFFKNNYSRLYYYALHFIPDSEVCKDIVSEAFRHLWEKVDIANVDSLLSYMFNHIHNLCIDHIRHDEVKSRYVESYLNTVSEMDEKEWEETELRILRIMEIISELPEQTKFVMEQHYLYKKKYKEIAEAIGLTESGVRKHIIKGLDIIRKDFSVKYKKGSD